MTVKYNGWLLAGIVMTIMLIVSAVYLLVAGELEKSTPTQDKNSTVAREMANPGNAQALSQQDCYGDVIVDDGTTAGQQLNMLPCNEAENYVGDCVKSIAAPRDDCSSGNAFCCAALLPDTECPPIAGSITGYRVQSVSCQP